MRGLWWWQVAYHVLLPAYLFARMSRLEITDLSMLLVPLLSALQVPHPWTFNTSRKAKDTS